MFFSCSLLWTPSWLRHCTADISLIITSKIFSLLCGAAFLMLGCYANQKEIIIGIPSANRNHSDLENLIGFFVNMNALYIDVDPTQMLANYWQKISSEIISAQTNQIPFEKLVKSLEIEKDLSRHPLFQVIFNLVGQPSINEENFVFTNYDPYKSNKIIKQAAKFDLEINVCSTGERMFGSFVFYTKVFHRETVRGFLSTYKNLLKQLAEFIEIEKIPGITLQDLRWIDSAQEHELTLYKDEPRTEIVFDTTSINIFEEVAQKSLFKIAIVCGKHSLTYLELNEKANQLANYLKQSVNNGN